MLHDTENPQALKDLFNTWETVDKDMPIIGNVNNNSINPNSRKRTFSLITLSDSEEESQMSDSGKQPRFEPISQNQTPAKCPMVGSLHFTPTTSSPSNNIPKLLQFKKINPQPSTSDHSTSLPHSLGEAKQTISKERNNVSTSSFRHDIPNEKAEELIKVSNFDISSLKQRYIFLIPYCNGYSMIFINFFF